MVKRPDWMTAPVDEDILYAIDNHSNMTPGVLSNKYMDFTSEYISQRCIVLVEKGLLYRVGRGLYGITDLGSKWINREITLEELEDAVND